MTLRRRVRAAVVGALAVSGVVHLVRPEVYDDLLPDGLPAPRAVNAVAGAVELACAYGLARRLRWAPAASAATLVAVWPTNLRYALHVTGEHGARSPLAVVAWARMPLQVPMIWAVLDPDD